MEWHNARLEEQRASSSASGRCLASNMSGIHLPKFNAEKTDPATSKVVAEVKLLAPEMDLLNPTLRGPEKSAQVNLHSVPDIDAK